MAKDGREMTEYNIKDIEAMKEEIKGLKGTISEFRARGCSIPRCEKCGDLLGDLYEDGNGHIHFCCSNCEWVDFKDTKIKFKCGRRWFDTLCENEGIAVEEEG